MNLDTRLPDLWSLLWQATFETLYIVGITLFLGGLLGLALGLALYVTRRGGLYANRAVNTVLNVLVNFFRPIPFVIFIAAVQPLARVVVGIGIGNRAIIFALTLAATFGISRIVEQNLVTVQPGVIEALGPLILGYTYVFVAIVDMSAIAGVVGGGGLGNFSLQYGYRQFDTVVTWTAVLIIVVLVQVVQLGGNTLARRVLRR